MFHPNYLPVSTALTPRRFESCMTIFTFNTEELHLSGLNGMARNPDEQKFRIIGFFFENRLYVQFEVRLLLFTVCTGA